MSGYLLAELRLRLGRALGALVGVALGMALYVGLTAVADGFAEAAKQPLAGIGADILISRLEVTPQPKPPAVCANRSVWRR